MKEKKRVKEQKLPQLSKMTLILRSLVAGYLLYTVFQLATSVKELSGTDLWVVAAAIIIFALIALPLGFMSLKDLLKGNYVDMSKDVRDLQTAEAVSEGYEDVSDKRE